MSGPHCRPIAGPLQAHCKPIAGIALRKQIHFLVPHCKPHSKATGRPIVRPLRAHCGPHCKPMAGPLHTHYWPIAIPKPIASSIASPLPGQGRSPYISLLHELCPTKTFSTQIPNYLPLSDRLATSCGPIPLILKTHKKHNRIQQEAPIAAVGFF